MPPCLTTAAPPALTAVHLLASPFVGGPERQALGLARALAPVCRTVFLSFAERGLAWPFLDEARRQGFEAVELKHNAPHLGRSAREVADHLARVGADVLCCHGYKPDIFGWRASRRAGIPAISIAHGWTGATWRVRVNEALDRWVMRWLDHTVCVSEAQAEKVLRAGVPPEKVSVIRNALDPAPFREVDPEARSEMNGFFSKPPAWVVGAAGRLSPEKGFDQLILAARQVLAAEPDGAFLIFGDGPLRPDLRRQITDLGLDGKVVLGGFRTDVARFLPHWDVAALSSHTEGLPVFVLEAQAAAVPVVATAVGGTPEVVRDRETGYLVPSGNPAALAGRILDLVRDRGAAVEMGARGRRHVKEGFSFASRAREYEALFQRLTARAVPGATRPGEKPAPATVC